MTGDGLRERGQRDEGTERNPCGSGFQALVFDEEGRKKGADRLERETHQSADRDAVGDAEARQESEYLPKRHQRVQRPVCVRGRQRRDGQKGRNEYQNGRECTGGGSDTPPEVNANHPANGGKDDVRNRPTTRQHTECVPLVFVQARFECRRGAKNDPAPAPRRRTKEVMRTID